MSIKMSDVFGAGFSLWNESGFINDGESDLGSMSCNSFTDAAVIAINSYDDNQALIAKQAEQIKLLRSTLIDTLTVVQGGLSSSIANGVKALEATKGQA